MSDRSTKTLPIQSEPVDAPSFDGEVVDGEVVGETTVPPRRATDDPTPAARPGARSWKARARASFGVGPRDEPEGFEVPGTGSPKPFEDPGESLDRRARREKDLAAAEQIEQTERDKQLKLRRDVRDAGARYMKSLQDSDILVPGFTDEQRKTRLSATHKVYARRMQQMCLESLHDGVHARSVTQVVGMLAMISLMSPEFRTHLREQRDDLRGHLVERIDARTRKEHARAGGDKEQLSARWQRRMERCEHRERGHREPFTEQSAGMTIVGLAESAYSRMRENPKARDQIQASYQAMVERVYSQAEQDGVPKKAVTRSARIVLGHRLDAEPELQCVFTGMAHGAYRKAPPRTVRLFEDGPEQMIWSGEFASPEGKTMPVDVMFQVRPSMTPEEHREWIASVMEADLMDAAGKGDPTAFNQDMAGYMAGWTRRGQSREAGDLDDVPRRMGLRIDESSAMIASMAADGLSEFEQKATFASAYADALERMQTKHPELGAAWHREYGDQWRSFVRVAVADPQSAAKFHTSWAADFPRPREDSAEYEEQVNEEGYQPV